jgi:DNA-binding NtrC family response regulator
VGTQVVSVGGKDAVQLAIATVVLEVVAGPDQGQRWVFDQTPLVVGTAEDADAVLTDPGVSRRHLRLTETADGLRVEDLDSTNGVRLGGARVRDVVAEEDVELELGATRLRVELRDETRTALLDAPDAAPAGPLKGGSQAMRALRGAIAAAAPSKANVLVRGESGTGKELVARALHEGSGRPGPLVTFDASTADPSTLRSDLFGHVQGAFTGAARDRPGAVRAAHQGTLFLDEVGELPAETQAMLLRVLEAREVKPMGADLAEPVDLRVVAATHRDLPAMVAGGSFRLDLYHRLAVLTIETPPLRERPEDVADLARHLTAELGLAVRLTPEAEARLREHPFPGNVRELRNVLERAALRAQPVGAEDLELEAPPREAVTPASDALEDATEAAAQEAIVAALEAEGGVRTRAARRLGISVATLWRRMKRYGLA